MSEKYTLKIIRTDTLVPSTTFCGEERNELEKEIALLLEQFFSTDTIRGVFIGKSKEDPPARDGEDPSAKQETGRTTISLVLER